MATTVSISTGDLKRIATKVTLAINDAILEREEHGREFNQEKREQIAKATAEGICKTLGIQIQSSSENSHG